MRTQSRIFAFKIIFSSLFNSEELAFENFAEEEKFNEKDLSFAHSIVDAFLIHRAEIEELLKANLENYELDRIYKVDMALLSLAVTEFKFLDTPKPVAVNEVVEIAKKYGTENSPKFINGVLAKVE